MHHRQAPTVGLLLTLMLALLAAPARACLWDSDTLEAESKGMPGVVDVITGRFHRNPPLYYELRIRRATVELNESPANLEAFDDLAVAYDRLGKGAEAIAAMEAKRKALDRMPAGDAEVRKHHYRYLANQGTFWAHRWFREGADRKRPEMLRRGRDLIRQAIELNPNAHFGREKYQLRALEWILDPADQPNLLGLNSPVHAARPFGHLASLGMGDAVTGLSGLIVLGNAWESVDVFEALTAALHCEGQSSLAYLARLRIAELAAQGKHSIFTVAAADTAAADDGLRHAPGLTESQTAELRSEFQRLRNAAEAQERKRTEFMLGRLRAGRHPDTDPTFWSGYQEPGKPLLSGWIWDGAVQLTPWLLLGFAARFALQRYRRRRLASQAAFAAAVDDTAN
ncbi:MAG: hypothetical protein ACO1SX_14890 [Actinomycetota bacterium]